MKVVLSNAKTLVIRFRRNDTFKIVTFYGPYNRKYTLEMFDGVQTTCYAHIGEEKVFEASTRHHEEDLFTKGEGRRRSLQKALDNSDFNRKDCALIWHEYFTWHNDLDK